MKIGVASPFRPHDLADLLDKSSRQLLAGLGGVSATPVIPLVRGWHRRGHDLTIYCLERSAPKTLILRGDRLSIQVIPQRLARYSLLDFYRTECRLIREAVRRDPPEVISAQWTYEHALAALQCGIPTAVTCHDTPWRYAWIGKNVFMTYRLALAWRVIRLAHRLVCVSPYTAQHIQKYFRPRCPVDIVPSGLMPEVFARGERRLQKGGSRPDSFNLCSVGGWGKLKNLATLLKAFAAVRHRHPSARLALFGRELGTGQAAEQWARRRQLHEGVLFKGHTAYEQVLDYLETEADLMVHPSLVETHGLALVEAMACGVPVIGGRHSGAVPWTLEEGRSGYLCDVRDERALAKTILEALEHADRNQTLVKHAWDSARRRFNNEQAVQANETILRELVTGRLNPLK
jgi:glycosyltransferase involved in cell wall biosynthesis